ncbi:sigma-70 family RNA polymerase sigma factor [Lottiidibacillus patelloidae]|uniref:sigma-70 family RNA polymerase sigma factor n=1 Tax=Lottiidibacillus patelloidae TaxID=2670334 RepID=UPI001E544B39|nr:sigma-70 family RNA polymerase sigma factor [Lottiidibacillus patelloidae]
MAVNKFIEPIYENDIQNPEEFLIRLMEEYGQSVARLAYTYVKDKALAEDISQEVFIKCYQNLKGFRNESSYKTWVYRITVNHCKDVLRSWTLRNVIPTEIFSSKREQHSFRGEESKSPEYMALSNENDSEIAEAVLKLPIKLREVIIFYYYEDQKIEEVANQLNLNVNTVKTRLMRAKKKLRKLMGGSHFE